MNLERLKKIQDEVNRFQVRLNEAIMLSEDTKGHESYSRKGEWYGVNEISGTAICGALKRGYLDLKYNLNPLLR